MIFAKRHSDVVARFYLPVAGLIAAAILVIIDIIAPHLYSALMTALIALPGSSPFEDWAVTPAVLSCAARGVNVFLPNNACGVILNYSPLWLILPILPGGHDWDIAFGTAIGLLFFASLALLSPARSWIEFSIRLMAMWSSGVALAVERGNVDIIIFIILLTGAFAIVRGTRLGAIGYVLFLVAALLKFYPVAALCVLVRERSRIIAAISVLTIAAAAWLIIGFRHELAMILAHLPAGGDWTMVFQSTALPDRFALALGRFSVFRAHMGMTARGVWGLWVLAMAASGIAIRWICGPRQISLPKQPDILIPMIMGAAVLLFCFLAGQNYIYRGIFLLPILPGLFEMARHSHPAVVRVLNSTSVLMVIALSAPLLHWALVATGHWTHIIQALAWLAYQLTWWWFAVVLCLILITYLIDSNIAGAVTRGRFSRAQSARWSVSGATARDAEDSLR
jgi:hypothetical protein